MALKAFAFKYLTEMYDREIKFSYVECSLTKINSEMSVSRYNIKWNTLRIHKKEWEIVKINSTVLDKYEYLSPELIRNEPEEIRQLNNKEIKYLNEIKSS